MNRTPEQPAGGAYAGRGTALAERAVEDMGLRRASSATAAEAASKPTASAENQLTAGSMLQDLFNRMRRGPAPVELDPAVSRDNAIVGAFLSSLTVDPVRR